MVKQVLVEPVWQALCSTVTESSSKTVIALLDVPPFDSSIVQHIGKCDKCRDKVESALRDVIVFRGDHPALTLEEKLAAFRRKVRAAEPRNMLKLQRIW
jgi:hypothetical protein